MTDSELKNGIIEEVKKWYYSLLRHKVITKDSDHTDVKMAQILIYIYEISEPMELDDMMDEVWLSGWNQAMCNIRGVLE